MLHQLQQEEKKENVPLKELRIRDNDANPLEFNTEQYISSQRKENCKRIIYISTLPITLCIVFIIRLLESIHFLNIIFSLISCIVILIKNKVNQKIEFLYLLFIIRNIIHIQIIHKYHYVLSKIRVSYAIISNISLIVYIILYCKQENVAIYYPLLCCVGFMLLSECFMISGSSISPHAIYDTKYILVDETKEKDLKLVGQHSANIDLDQFSECIREMKMIYASNITRIISNRKEQLRNLFKIFQENESLIWNTIKSDLQRNETLTSVIEIAIAKAEIKDLLHNLDEWASPHDVPMHINSFPSVDYCVWEPRGTVLIHGIWNFPYQLTLVPIAGAIAAGNNVIVKVCNDAPESAKLICDLLHKYMDPRFVQCIGHPSIANGDDRVITAKLMENEFDLIFFTGSSNGGKYIQKEASKFMTPVILECGGKNACFVDDTAAMDTVARTLISARVMNCGQFCLEPDLVFIYENKLNEFLFQCKTFIYETFKMGNEMQQDLGENQAKFINKKEMQRVVNMLHRTKGKIVIGGNYDENNLMMEPTVVLLDAISSNDMDLYKEPTITEETFGPILWIVPIKSNRMEDAVRFMNKYQEKPLAVYIFSERRKTQNYILMNTSSGGVQINGCMLQAAQLNAPFGGIGKSGIGSYHSKYSFEAFSHRKPITKSFWEMRLVQPPINTWKKSALSLVF